MSADRPEVPGGAGGRGRGLRARLPGLVARLRGARPLPAPGAGADGPDSTAPDVRSPQEVPGPDSAAGTPADSTAAAAVAAAAQTRPEQAPTARTTASQTGAAPAPAASSAGTGASVPTASSTATPRPGRPPAGTRPAGRPVPRPLHASRRRLRQRVARATAMTMTVMLVALVSAVGSIWYVLQDGITTVSVDGMVAAVTPTSTTAPTQTQPDDPLAGNAVNILVMGSDDREDESNHALGGGDMSTGNFSGMRSDTTIVVHISADRSRIELISIPRDSLVQVPSCTMTDGTVTEPYYGMFNSAFATGASEGGDLASAAACTINTVQANTGLVISDFIVVDMNGFVRMVDALGGVRMCIPEEMHAPKARLHLYPGEQVLDGKTALGFARARTGTGVGDGSDINRMGRQQELIAAVLSEVLGKNVLTDVGELLSFGRAATSSLSMSSRLSGLEDLVGLAYSLRGIRSSSISLTTIPWGEAPTDRNRVVWTVEAAIIWSNLAQDVPMLTGTGLDDGTVDEAPATDGTVVDGGAIAAADGTAIDGGATTDQPQTDPAAAGATTDPVAEPTPGPTREAGREAFTADAMTSTSCG